MVGVSVFWLERPKRGEGHTSPIFFLKVNG